MLSAADGCEPATTTPVKAVWKNFNELLPVLSSRNLSYKTRGRVYRSCVQNAMLHASETRVTTERHDQPEDVATVRSNKLLARSEIDDLDVILREKASLGWTRWKIQSHNAHAQCDMQIEGKSGAGRPKMTWRTLTERDCREWKLNNVVWRSNV